LYFLLIASSSTNLSVLVQFPSKSSPTGPAHVRRRGMMIRLPTRPRSASSFSSHFFNTLPNFPCWCTGRAPPASPGGSTKLVTWSILRDLRITLDEIYERDPSNEVDGKHLSANSSTEPELTICTSKATPSTCKIYVTTTSYLFPNRGL
jgi:hypothetical protein